MDLNQLKLRSALLVCVSFTATGVAVASSPVIVPPPPHFAASSPVIVPPPPHLKASPVIVPPPPHFVG